MTRLVVYGEWFAESQWDASSASTVVLYISWRPTKDATNG